MLGRNWFKVADICHRYIPLDTLDTLDTLGYVRYILPTGTPRHARGLSFDVGGEGGAPSKPEGRPGQRAERPTKKKPRIGAGQGFQYNSSMSGQCAAVTAE